MQRRLEKILKMKSRAVSYRENPYEGYETPFTDVGKGQQLSSSYGSSKYHMEVVTTVSTTFRSKYLWNNLPGSVKVSSRRHLHYLPGKFKTRNVMLVWGYGW